ncbi:MAG: hypothetical protein CMH57_14870 [Myxococcales bacterium]|nr:hypothetical protein [Myxococcales bacterium]
MFKPRSEEEAIARILDGTTWAEFCDTLKMAGMIMDRDGSPDDAFNRAEGYRYLSRIARAALQTFVEHADPRAPVLQRVVHETAKMGSDNPDNYYQNAAISGAYTYRITGDRGSVHILSFHTQVGHYGQGGGMPPTGKLEARDMVVAPDGSFEIVLSCERPDDAPNWLPMTPETGTLIVRQTFLDRSSEQLASLHIERLDGPGGPTPLTPQALDHGLTTSANLVVGAASLFASWAEGFTAHTNTLPLFDPARSTQFGGDPNITYYHSYWALGPDEALVIEATPPECLHWNFQLNNHWMESLDYRYFKIHVNKHTAAYEDDGSVRIVVAHTDPGHPNWIQTVGHDRGTMCFRWFHADDPPQPQTRVVTMDELSP